jgi:hypothetical protein
MMNRRLLVTLTAWLPLGAMVSACASPSAPGYLVTTAQLEDALAQRFPLRYQVPGLVELNVARPRLQLLPELNRIASEMAIEASGPALRRSYSGEFDLDFALRYEPSDQSIRAHGLKVQSLRLAGLPPDAASVLQAYAAAMAQQNLPEVVLHRLRPSDLALPDAMGLRPGAITVTREGLRIAFVNKRAP